MDSSDLLADLPDPHDDEPTSLRSDIAEELTDHLVCSVRREMVKGADESTAWERALKRFGDPRQIARKLWWLAMRRRIMNQRLMLGLQGAMLLAVIAVAAVMIQMSNAQQRQMAQQQEFLSAALAKLSERLDAAMRAPVTVPDAALTVEVQYARPDEPRRSGESAEYTVSLRGVDISNETIKAERPCDPKTGIASFGALPPGGYEVWVSAQFGMLRAVRRIEVDRGERRREVFDEPPLRVRDETVTLDVNVPADFRATLDNQHLAVLLELTPEPVSFHDQDWELERPLRLIWTPERTLTTWSTLGISPEDLHRDVVRKNLLAGIGSNGASWPEEDGFKPHQFSRRKGARFRLKTVGIIANPFWGAKPGSEGQLYMSRSIQFSVAAMLDSTSPDWPAELDTVFVAEADKPWRVTLPPALTAAARAQLAELAAQPPLPGRPVAGDPAPSTADSAHNRVQVRVVEGTEDGPVVKQVHVTLTQPAWSKPLSPVVGPEGLLDFGYLDAGLYTLSASLSWGPTQEHQFVVHPGKEHVETLITPNPPNQIIAIKVKVPLNAVLKGNGARVALFPVLTALTGPASNWETRKFVRVFRKQAADGSAVPDDRFENGTIALTEWEGDSLTGVMHILPGTYAVREATLDIGRVRSLNVQQQLQVSLVPFLESQLRSQKSFTESGQEWQIDLPEDRLKELTRAVETQSQLKLGADRPQTSVSAAASPDAATRDPKHNRVQVRVVEGNADGPVITTATAWLTQPDWEKPLAPVIEDDGTLDFGYLDAGVYSLTTLLKWGPKGERRFVVHPGKNVVETVVAPVSPEHGLEVRIVAPLPAKLREAGVVLQLDPQPAGFAAPFEAWKWETEGFYDTIRGTSGGGKLPPIRLTEQVGDSLIGTITLPPGTYICPTASLRDRSLKRVLAQGKLLNHDNSGIARPNEGIITLTKPDQEWRIDLPTDLVGEAIDALTAAQPASK